MRRNADLWLGALFFLLVTGLCLFFQQTQNGGLIRESGVLDDSISTPFTLFQPEQNRISGTVVVLLHGRRCSSSMMASFGRMLARNGFKTYAIDLPGHGRSSVTLPLWCPPAAFPNSRCRTEEEYLALTSEALRAIRLREGSPLDSLVLAGHSWGGRLGHDLLKKWPLAGITPFLVNLDGELTSAGYTGENLFTVRVGPYRSEENQLTVPESHLSVIRSEEVNEKVLAWLSRRFPLAAEAQPGARFVPAILLFVCLSLACAWAIGWFPCLWPAKKNGRERNIDGVLGLGLIIGSAAVVQAFIGLVLPMKHFWQWQIYFQNIYFFTAGVSGWLVGAMLAIRAGKVRAPPFIFRSLLLAAASFLFLGVSLFWFANENFFHLGFSVLRAQKFFIYLPLLLPLCFVLFRMDVWYRLIAWSVFLFLASIGPKSMDPLEAAFIILIIAFIEVLAERLARTAGSTDAGAFLLCFLLSWWAAAAYPTTTIFSPSLDPQNFLESLGQVETKFRILI